MAPLELKPQNTKGASKKGEARPKNLTARLAKKAKRAPLAKIRDNFP